MQILNISLSKGLETIGSLPQSLKTISSLPKSFKPGGEGSPVAGCNTQDLDWGSYIYKTVASYQAQRSWVFLIKLIFNYALYISKLRLKFFRVKRFNLYARTVSYSWKKTTFNIFSWKLLSKITWHENWWAYPILFVSARLACNRVLLPW